MRRRTFLRGVLVVPVVLAACGPNPVAKLAAISHKAPLAPSDLSQLTPSGQALAAAGWTNQSSARLQGRLSSPESGATLQAEAEFRPLGEPFTGTPNASGKPGDPFVLSPAMAAGQRYHWQLRAKDVGGPTGPWVPFDGSLGFDPAPPPSPSIIAPSNGGFVSQKQVKISWDAVAGKSGIAGYAYALDQQQDGLPPERVLTTDPSATISPARDGDWYFHVRTLDNAGNWSPVASQLLHVDTVPLKITDPFYRTFAYNPDFDLLHISFSISKPAAVVVTILPDKASSVLRTLDLGQQPQGKVDLQWDGKQDNGTVVPPGNYRFRVVAKDRGGSSADAVYDQLLVTRKRIVVSLAQQKMWAYDGDSVFLQSLVTTGGPLLPTPEGTFQVLTKQKDFTFKSPWPKGSPFWYPDSPTHFAMMFDDGGYFLHDAPWRHKFGPGSNLVAGQPGEETSGTHGCVNVPLDVQTKLFGWTDLGTPVVIQQ